MKEKIKVGIVGYGNLGKGVEAALNRITDFELIAVFTKRNPESLSSPYNTPFKRYDEIKDFAGRINTMFLCGGSFNDIEQQGSAILESFNTVDSFDTHAKINSHIKELQPVALKNKTVAVTSCGWDPGIMSMMRLIFNAVSKSETVPNSFWGEGVSQGHGDAIRRIEGVENAIQYTVPNSAVIKLCQEQPGYIPRNQDKHTRKCFVAVKEGFDKEDIEKQIVTMPHYFADYSTTVNFVSANEIEKMQQKMFHKGYVIKNYETEGDRFKMEFSLDIASNPTFTAEVLVSCAYAVCHLTEIGQYGAYTVFDIPLKYLTLENRESLIEKLM